MGILDKLLDRKKQTAEELHVFALQETANPQEALDYLTKAIEKNPKMVGAWIDKGNVLNILRRNKDALNCYNKALEIDSKNYVAWTNIGDIRNSEKNYDGALECYNKALEICPDDEKAKNGVTDILLKKGNYLLGKKMFEEAIKFYDMALEVDPMFYKALCNKGSALSYMIRYDEAIKQYDMALNINPNDKMANEGKAAVKYKLTREKGSSELDEYKRIYLDFIQVEQENIKRISDEIVRETAAETYRKEEKFENAIVQTLLSKSSRESDKAHAIALKKITRKYNISRPLLASIIKDFKDN
jgi:tetratricopeptide (TPR) repeat protein